MPAGINFSLKQVSLLTQPCETKGEMESHTGWGFQESKWSNDSQAMFCAVTSTQCSPLWFSVSPAGLRVHPNQQLLLREGRCLLQVLQPAQPRLEQCSPLGNEAPVWLSGRNVKVGPFSSSTCVLVLRLAWLRVRMCKPSPWDTALGQHSHTAEASARALPGAAGTQSSCGGLCHIPAWCRYPKGHNQSPSREGWCFMFRS